MFILEKSYMLKVGTKDDFEIFTDKRVLFEQF